jgi:FHA domain
MKVNLQGINVNQSNQFSSVAAGNKGVFFILDGNNIYRHGRDNAKHLMIKDGPVLHKDGTQKIDDHGKPAFYYHPPNPRLDVVEALVVYFIDKQYRFKVFFDSPSLPHFKNTQKKNPEKFPDIYERFKTLCALKTPHGTSACEHVTGVQADSPVLSEALMRLREGYEVRIITCDKYDKNKDQHERDFGEVILPRINGIYPKRCLPFYFQTFSLGDRIAFEDFPVPLDGRGINVSRDLTFDRLKIIYKNYEEGKRIPASETGKQIFQGKPAASIASPQPAVSVDTKKPVLAAILNTSLNVSPLRLTGNPHEVVLSDFGNLNNLAPQADCWPITVGRDDSATPVQRAKLERDLLVNSKFGFVSGLHVQFDFEKDTQRVYVTDLSTNGTWLDNEKLVKNNRTLMTNPFGLLHLSGSNEGDGVVNLFYYLDNIEEVEELVDSEPTGRRLTQLRAATPVRTLTQMRQPKSDAQPSLPTMPALSTEAKTLTLHYRFANGIEGNCSLAHFPYYIGTSVKQGLGLELPTSLCKGVAPTHLCINGLVNDPFTNQLIALKTRPSGSTHKNNEAVDSMFMWNIVNSAVGGKDSVTLAPEVGSQPVELWVTLA